MRPAAARATLARWNIFITSSPASCNAQLGGQKDANLTAGSYALSAAENGVCISRRPQGNQAVGRSKKNYEPLAGQKIPGVIIGHERDIKGQPFLGNEDARLQVLLPDQPAFDMAVNIFTYQPGATLPFVETHIMEHGLLMLKGQGVYRLDADHHPVRLAM